MRTKQNEFIGEARNTILFRFAIIYHLTKPSKKKSHFNSQDPLPPPRSDSLGTASSSKAAEGGGMKNIEEVDGKK